MSKQKDLKLPIIVLGIGVFLLILKFAAWWWTNSNAILTDALESIINIVAGIFALYSLSLAWKPKDQDHPYGHGKIEFLSAGFEGALILMAVLIILFKSCWDFFHPHEVSGLDLGLVITAFSGLINYVMGHFLIKRSKNISSITLEASGKHLKSDAYSSIGLIIGLGIVMFSGIDKLDNVVAVLFGFIIIITGYGLLRKSIAGIMDEADEKLIRSFVDEVDTRRSDDWVDMHNVRMIQYGSNLHLDCHLTLPWYYDTRQSHDLMKEFEDLVIELSERPIELFVHVDPCEPLSCQICQKKDCTKRQDPQKERITWTFENTTANKKHNY
jgi:cation diffusion facilitator family transporter